MDAFDVYSQQLFCLKKGQALYEPDPAGMYDFVRVGDVGHISYGAFQRAFNIFCTADDPINDRGVPEDFEPCPQWRELQRRTPLAPGPMYSTHVRACGGNLQASS